MSPNRGRRDVRREERRRQGLRTAALVAVVVLGGGYLAYDVVGSGDDDDASVAGEAAARTGTTEGDGPDGTDDTGDDTDDGSDDTDGADAAPTTTASTRATTTTVPETTTTTRPPYDGWVDPLSSGEPYGTEVEGLLTFRGNPTRSYYGAGPVPATPSVAWTLDVGCSESSVGGETRSWCGTGWTGQPSVFERDGRTWVVFGGYDRAVHFLDADTGERILPDFPTGDIIKGSVTVDPDGYPIVYSGSRDNYYRAIAIDRDPPVELWRLAADDVSPTLWNNDWDGAGLVLDDHLFEGGENSQFHIVRLNRGYGPDGLVTVAPELVFHAPGWDDELLAAIGDHDVSIENSVAISGDTVYFANSGGLVQGWDISTLRDGGTPTRTFRYWVGDDVDASIVIDDEGFLYVGVEWERYNARAAEVGQVVKLDPRAPDPLVWSYDDQARGADSGVWATPGIVDDVVIVPTDSGRIVGLDRATGELLWELRLPGPTWQSPVIVDGVWIQGDCSGFLHGYDVTDPRVQPQELWSVELGGCVESTPAVWGGGIYVGTRSGRFFALR
jgi:hypothetical protein